MQTSARHGAVDQVIRQAIECINLPHLHQVSVCEPRLRSTMTRKKKGQLWVIPATLGAPKVSAQQIKDMIDALD